MVDGAKVIGILGAESTGKTTLARALAERLGELTGRRSVWIPEHLREWFDAAGRPPHREEQAAIAARQTELIDAAAARHDIVVSDTTALMTAVYSRIVFADSSLDAMAIEGHRRCTITLVTAIDLPWVADAPREGPHVQQPVDDCLRTLLQAHDIRYTVIGGSGAARLEAAVAAVMPALAASLG